MSETAKVRQIWPDILKLIAMWMIFSIHSQHCGNYQYFCRILPLQIFIFSSGLFIHKSLLQKPVEFIKNSFMRLMVPYFVFAVISIFPMLWLNDDSLADMVLKTLYGAREHLHVATLWFLPALFCSRILFYAVWHFSEHFGRNSGKKKLALLVSATIIISLISIVFRHFMDRIVIAGIERLPLPWNADWAGISLPWVLAGYLLSDKAKNFTWKSSPLPVKAVMAASIAVAIATFIRPELLIVPTDMLRRLVFPLNTIAIDFVAPFFFGLAFFVLAKQLNRFQFFSSVAKETMLFCGLESIYITLLFAIHRFCALPMPGTVIDQTRRFVPWGGIISAAIEILIMYFLLVPLFRKTVGKFIKL